MPSRSPLPDPESGPAKNLLLALSGQSSVAPSSSSTNPHAQPWSLAILGRRPVLRWVALTTLVVGVVYVVFGAGPGQWTMDGVFERPGLGGLGGGGGGGGAGGRPWGGPGDLGVDEGRPGLGLDADGEPIRGVGGERPVGGDAPKAGGNPPQGNPPQAGAGGNRPTKAGGKDAELWKKRKLEVQASFLHAWNGYVKLAFPADELLPVSGGKKNGFNGWAVTVVDSLSTMWLMGLKTEFYDAVKMIEKQRFDTISDRTIPFFETIIRYLGGYLSAYALSSEPILLSLADRLGERLMPAFNTSSGLPAGGVDLEGKTEYGMGLLAEIGSCQLEFKYLAKLTGKKEYYEKPHAVLTHLHNATSKSYDGLYSEHWNIATGMPTGGSLTLAANTDSAYEYFLKQYLMFGDKLALEMWLNSMNGVMKHLLYVSPRRGLLYLTDMSQWGDEKPQATHRHEHLGCFLGGMFALGAAVVTPERLQRDFPTLTPSEITALYPPSLRQKHRWAAEGLTYTCYALYADSSSGLSSDATRFETAVEVVAEGGKGQKTTVGPRRWEEVLRAWEEAQARGGVVGDAKGKGQGERDKRPPGTRHLGLVKEKGKRDYVNSWPERWLSRPETVESIYLMYKTTKDPVWRERGYEIYSAIAKHAKTVHGFSSVSGCDSDGAASGSGVYAMEEMPSYFLAETLKYLHLLFDDEDPVDLDKWVFNTEAHPLPVVSWTKRERERFGVV